MTRTSLLVRTAVAAVLIALVLFGPVLVTVDDYPRWLAHGTTVGGLVGSGDVRAFPRDLLDVQGRFLAPRKGGAPVVAVDGVEASADTVLWFGSRVVSDRGPDALESTVAVTVETTPSVHYRGHGPVESIELAGPPGQTLVVRGAVSGIELKRTVISGPASVTVRREPAWTGAKRVALTFDDGPWPGQTDKFVAALQEADVHGTFFMVGYLATRHAELARLVADAGMEIGAHSQSHKLLKHQSRKTVRSQIVKGVASLVKATGQRPAFFRPPGGSVNVFVYQEARRAKLRVVMWTVDPHDYRNPGAAVIARRVLDNIRPGSVVLMHDGGGNRMQTLAALKIVLQGLAARGYEAVTLSELYAKPLAR